MLAQLGFQTFFLSVLPVAILGSSEMPCSSCSTSRSLQRRCPCACKNSEIVSGGCRVAWKLHMGAWLLCGSAGLRGRHITAVTHGPLLTLLQTSRYRNSVLESSALSLMFRAKGINATEGKDAMMIIINFCSYGSPCPSAPRA